MCRLYYQKAIFKVFLVDLSPEVQKAVNQPDTLIGQYVGKGLKFLMRGPEFLDKYNQLLSGMGIDSNLRQQEGGRSDVPERAVHPFSRTNAVAGEQHPLYPSQSVRGVRDF